MASSLDTLSTRESDPEFYHEPNDVSTADRTQGDELPVHREPKVDLCEQLFRYYKYEHLQGPDWQVNDDDDVDEAKVTEAKEEEDVNEAVVSEQSFLLSYSPGGEVLQNSNRSLDDISDSTATMDDSDRSDKENREQSVSNPADWSDTGSFPGSRALQRKPIHSSLSDACKRPLLSHPIRRSKQHKAAFRDTLHHETVNTVYRQVERRLRRELRSFEHRFKHQEAIFQRRTERLKEDYSVQRQQCIEHAKGFLASLNVEARSEELEAISEHVGQPDVLGWA
ncbi:hypothetical protein MGN70_009401 [Eutypa lata]|nr:hypothetical protein MGN70_009401 [Eutypa lata]